MSTSELIFIFVVAGLIVSLNPTTIAIFSALLAGSLGKGHSKLQQHVIALTFLLTTFCLYALGGIAVVILLNLMGHQTLLNFGLFVGFCCTIWGLVNIRNYYWYGKHRDVSIRLSKSLHTHTIKKNDPVSAAILGISSAYAALPGVGMPIVAFAMILALSQPDVINLMLVPALVLLLPLVIIFILSLRKLKLSSVLKWKEDSKGVFRLCIGITTIVLGWIIFLILNGSIGVMA